VGTKDWRVIAFDQPGTTSLIRFMSISNATANKPFTLIDTAGCA